MAQLERSGAPAGSLALQSFETRYQPGELLGEGGMGEVRLARDARIGREVAVKTMRREIGARGESRFLREARVQGQLEHPAIVPVYDLGVTRDGETYFTMKRVRGRSLDSILEALAAGELDTVAEFTRRRLLTAFSQVCLAVEFAHARGVLHRDLKPANIMIGDFGEVYVLDWGLAKVRDLDELPASSADLAGTATPTRRWPARRWARPATWRPSRRAAISSASTSGATSTRSARSSSSCSFSSRSTVSARRWEG